jgi:hypothetical protein
MTFPTTTPECILIGEFFSKRKIILKMILEVFNP